MTRPVVLPHDAGWCHTAARFDYGPPVRTALVVAVLLAACGSSSPATHDAAVDAVDAAPLPDGKASACASTFGSALTSAFGRLDGTILAVVEPGNMACAMPNSTHVIIEVTANGAAYRMVANVLSTSSDPHVWLDEIDAPLAGDAWAEGWHPGLTLDYVTTLQVAKTAFTQADQAAAVARFESELVPGARVSVYATSSGGDSAHLIHRNATNQDGAVVLAPDTAPHYLLTAFPEQTF